MSKIMLAKDLKDLKKPLQFPVMVSEKLDGTAVDINENNDALSRQDKPYRSIPHIQAELAQVVGSVLGELHIPGMAFKDSGGAIRRHTPDDRIKLGVYDYMLPTYEHIEYQFRIENLQQQIDTLQLKHVFIIPYTICNTLEEIEAIYQKTIISSPFAEGICIRPVTHLFQPGKRSWDMLRQKKESTIDLMVTGFEEAISKEGKPKGMIGKIILAYKGTSIGATPGKTNHKERTALWEEFTAGTFKPRLAEITYKPDPSYTALREARFTRWRFDKTIPDV